MSTAPTATDALHALASSQQHALTTYKMVQELCSALVAERTPPLTLPFALSTAVPVARFEHRDAFASFTVVNPTAAQIYLSPDGQLDVRPGNRTPSIPPRSLLTLPIPVERLDLGATAADLATGDLVGWAIFHTTLQTPFLGGQGVTT